MKQQTNSFSLLVWIAEHGDREARKLICETAKIHDKTLWRILQGDMPRIMTRYHIYKLTGIKLNDQDEFPELQKMNAS
jgi:hypothetical protein